jgi:plastocyanin
MDRRHFLRAAAAAGIPVALAGCTGDGDDGGDGDATPTATDEPMDTPTATDEPTGTPTATDEPMGTPTATDEPTDSPTATAEPTPTPTATPEPDQRVTVAPDGRLRFDPESFTIAAGDTVLWEWVASGHNVSPESQPDGADWAGDDGSLYSSGYLYSNTFETAGEYRYHCDPHQGSGMVGSFTVE